jgi:superfamily II DNA or RNA helicase
VKYLPHQLDAIDRALAAPGQRWLFADEMGCGKTAEAIETWKRLGVERGVVVAPAMARPGWVKQFEQWWPEQQVAMIDMSPTRKTQTKARRASWDEVLSRSARIVSPELLNAERERVLLEAGGVLVIDEVHMLANPSTKRSNVLRWMAKRHKGPVLVLSATPIPNKVMGLFNIVDTVWPMRFGKGDGRRPGFSFLRRYLERIYTVNGTDWGGLLDEYAEELRYRLGFMMSRVTRAALAGHIPQFQIKPLRVPGNIDPDTFVLDWAREVMHEAKHVAVLTHRRASAARLAAVLSGLGRPTVLVDGSIPTTPRAARIAALREQPAGFLVSTMHAVSESISLSWCHRNLLAELYWSPKVLTQVAGRFPRLDGTAPTVLEILVRPNSVEERMAVALNDKLWQISQVTKEGEAEHDIRIALNDEDDLEKLLAEAAFSVCSDEEASLFDAMGEE